VLAWPRFGVVLLTELFAAARCQCLWLPPRELHVAMLAAQDVQKGRTATQRTTTPTFGLRFPHSILLAFVHWSCPVVFISLW